MFELAAHQRLPVVLFAEGGGGRPGDTDGVSPTGLDCPAFNLFGRLSGLVPLVGITSGRCFAGNAALLGCCDVIIATEGFEHRHGRAGDDRRRRPRRLPPRRGRPDRRAGRQRRGRRRGRRRSRSGARRQAVCLATSRARSSDWECADQRLLRAHHPRKPPARLRRARRHRDPRRHATRCSSCAATSASAWSPRSSASKAGRSASSPTIPIHLGGAIDSDGADKAARFMQLCDAFDLPILFLCDTPGIMVGPEVEKTALVRHAAAHVRDRREPHRAVLHHRPAQGLRPRRAGDGGRQFQGAACSPSPGRPASSAAWASKARSSSAIATSSRRSRIPQKRKAFFDEMVARMYEHGKAVNIASAFEIDDVIDPDGVAQMDHGRARFLAAARSAHRQKTLLHRHLVTSDRPRTS